MKRIQNFSTKESKNLSKFIDEFQNSQAVDPALITYYKLLSSALKHADASQIMIGEKNGELEIGAVSKTLAERIDYFIPFALKGGNKEAMESITNFYKDVNALPKDNNKIQQQAKEIFAFNTLTNNGIDDPVQAILSVSAIESYGKSKEEQQPFADLAEQIKQFSPLYKNSDVSDIFGAFRESPIYKKYLHSEQGNDNFHRSNMASSSLLNPQTTQNITSGLYTLAGIAVVGALSFAAKKLHAGNKAKQRQDAIKELIEQDALSKQDTKSTKRSKKRKAKNNRKHENASISQGSTLEEEHSQPEKGIPRVISTERANTLPENNEKFSTTQSPALTALTTPTTADTHLTPFSLNEQSSKDEEIAALKEQLKQSKKNEQSANEKAAKSTIRAKKAEALSSESIEQAKEEIATLKEQLKQSRKNEQSANDRARNSKLRAKEEVTNLKEELEQSRNNESTIKGHLDNATKQIASMHSIISDMDKKLQVIPELERNAYNAGHFNGSAETHPMAYHAGFIDGCQNTAIQQQQNKPADIKLYFDGLADGSKIAVTDAEKAVRHGHEEGKKEGIEEGYKNGFEDGYAKGITTAMQKTYKEFIEEGKKIFTQKDSSEKSTTHTENIPSGRISPTNIASEKESRQKAV